MNLLDIILLIILGGFVFFGFWLGLIHALGALVGVIIGALAAGHYYEPIAQWLYTLAGGNLNIIRLISFILVFVIVNRLVGFLFWIIERIFKIISIIPFLKSINRLAGAVFGFLEGLFVLGLILYVASRYPLGSWFIKALTDSSVAHWLIGIGKVLAPLLPKFLQALKSII